MHQPAGLLNPENQHSLPIISHQIYNSFKHNRKQVQSQRRQVEQGVSFLARQAKKSARDLANKQKTLINYYKMKEDRFEEHQRQWRQKKEEDLQNMRKTNQLFRDTSTSKRREVRNSWIMDNKKSFMTIKHSHHQLEKRLSEERKLECELLRKRNEVFNKANVLGSQNSRAQSMLSNKCKSSVIITDLIEIESKVKEKEIEQIGYLSRKQKQLLSIVERTAKQKLEYENTLKKAKNMTFHQLYSNVLENGLLKSQRKNSKSLGRVSNRSG